MAVVESSGSGSSSARLECTVRDREVGSSNLPFPTSHTGPVTNPPKRAAREPSAVRELVAGEHAVLRRHLRTLRSVAESMWTEQPLALRRRLDSVMSFLREEALPHMELEETTTYALVDKLPGGPNAGAAMALDHAAIRALVRDVDKLTSGLASKQKMVKLQGALFALEALLRLHIEKEEALYLPVLNRLSPTVLETVAAQIREVSVKRTRR
jgi:hemerythrin-like domain-containing protein